MTHAPLSARAKARAHSAWLTARWGTPHDAQKDMTRWLGRYVKSSKALQRDCPDALQHMQVVTTENPLSVRVQLHDVSVVIFFNDETGILEVDTYTRESDGRFHLWESMDHQWRELDQWRTEYELHKQIGRALDLSQKAVTQHTANTVEAAGDSVTIGTILTAAFAGICGWLLLWILAPLPA